MISSVFDEKTASLNKFRPIRVFMSCFCRSAWGRGWESARPQAVFFRRRPPSMPKKTPAIRPGGANGWSCSKASKDQKIGRVRDRRQAKIAREYHLPAIQ